MLAVLLMDSQPLFIFSGDDCHQHRAAAATAPADSIHWKYLRQRALFAGARALKSADYSPAIVLSYLYYTTLLP